MSAARVFRDFPSLVPGRGWPQRGSSPILMDFHDFSGFWMVSGTRARRCGLGSQIPTLSISNTPQRPHKIRFTAGDEACPVEKPCQRRVRFVIFSNLVPGRDWGPAGSQPDFAGFS